jgi:hypothetical protein
MIHTIENPRLYVAAPAVMKFLNPLPEAINSTAGNWGWVNMIRLDEAVTSALKKAGCTSEKNSLILDYASFAEFLTTEEGKKGFDWFTYFGHLGHGGPIDLHLGEHFSKDLFTDQLLYVPAGFGGIVLDFAKKGIVKVERTDKAKSGWHFVSWTGETFPLVLSGDPCFTPKVTVEKNESWILESALELGFIDPVNASGLQIEAATANVGLVELMFKKGFLDHAKLAQIKSAQFGAEVVFLSKIEIPPEIISIIPAHIARKYQVIPVSKDQSSATLKIAIADPSDLNTIDSLMHLVGGHSRSPDITICVALEDELQAALDKYYPAEPIVLEGLEKVGSSNASGDDGL